MASAGFAGKFNVTGRARTLNTFSTWQSSTKGETKGPFDKAQGRLFDSVLCAENAHKSLRSV
jgi:hypothetical protein